MNGYSTNSFPNCLVQALNAESTYCPPEPMNSEDMLYILYTSGSTAKPKGIVHTHAGYLLFASTTYQVGEYNVSAYISL